MQASNGGNSVRGVEEWDGLPFVVGAMLATLSGIALMMVMKVS